MSMILWGGKRAGQRGSIYLIKGEGGNEKASEEGIAAIFQ